MTRETNDTFFKELKLVDENFLDYVQSLHEAMPHGDLRPKLQDYLKRMDAFYKLNLEMIKPPKSTIEPMRNDPNETILPTIRQELERMRINQEDNKLKRHISWDEYFMSVALLAAKRSKDPSTQVGACIVNEQNKIVATGYNGMPNGVKDEEVPWKKEGSFLETKYAYVVHAELNAILNCILTDQTGCRVYVSLFPCNECAKAIIQSGIRHVIYLSDKHEGKEATKAAKIMFQMAGVSHERYSDRRLEKEH